MRLSFLMVVMGLAVAFVSAAPPQEWFNLAEEAYQRFDNQQALQLYEKVYAADPEYPEILFRLARVHTDIGEEFEDQDNSKAAREHYEKALHYARLAVQKFPDSAESHLWMATALGRLAYLAGGKEKVRLSRDVKRHLDRALELDPNSATAHAALGVYHREVASLNWFLRKVAVKLFGGLPPVSLEESRAHLQRAIELRPHWIFAHLELGKTLWKMGKKDEARRVWQEALQLPRTDHRDPAYLAEIKWLLKQ